jgi:hypothetical protein
LSKRAQRAFDESIEAARIGQQRLDGLRTRLEFYSGELEAGCYVCRAAEGGRDEARGAAMKQPPVLGGVY